jgi:hypothetical protein
LENHLTVPSANLTFLLAKNNDGSGTEPPTDGEAARV